MVVKNMATAAEQTEKISLNNYAKKHVRYGSMAKESGLRSERYIKHTVQPGDTLQGLALRYGVTVSRICLLLLRYCICDPPFNVHYISNLQFILYWFVDPHKNKLHRGV